MYMYVDEDMTVSLYPRVYANSVLKSVKNVVSDFTGIRDITG